MVAKLDERLKARVTMTAGVTGPFKVSGRRQDIRTPSYLHPTGYCQGATQLVERGDGERMAKVTFIGLGVMGYPMARHLAQRGEHQRDGVQSHGAKAAKWVAEYGGRQAPTPKAAAEGADFVFTCVGNDDDLRAVTLGPDGAFAGMRPGAVYIDNTTASAIVARELYERRRRSAVAEPGCAGIRADRPEPRTGS